MSNPRSSKRAAPAAVGAALETASPIPPAQPPVEQPPVEQPPEQPEPDNPPGAPETTEDEPAELGLSVDEDGLVSLVMLVGLCGPDLSLSPRDEHRCAPAAAVRLIRAGFARAASGK